MQDKYHVLRSIMIVTLFWGIVASVTSSAELTVTEQTLEVIRESMALSPTPWTGERQRDYLDTIRQALSDDHDKPDYTARIEIFRRGFPTFWSRRQASGLTQAEYDMFKAEIRWFCETLTAEEPASISERALLKSQVRDLCDYATEHLRAQFPFLTAACVEQGKTAALKEFDHELENPLVPIFRRPFSQDQMKIIKSNWARSYKRWYSFWRNIRYSTVDREDLSDPNEDNSVQAHREAENVKKRK